MALLLKLGEVAEMLRLSRGQVYALARSGELPTIRLGAHGLRVNPDALETWLASRTISGEQP